MEHARSGELHLSSLIPFVAARPEDAEQFVDQARSGLVHRLWQGQGMLLDTYQMFAASQAGGRFRVGVGVGLMPLRHPLEAALQARSLAALAGPGVVAGFGPGSTDFQRAMLGTPYGSPLAATREYLTIVRDLLAGAEVAHDGEYFRVHGALPPLEAGPVETGLGVLRPGMARLCGELADVAITWLTPARYLAETIAPAIREGAGTVSRPEPARITAIVPVALLGDVDAAQAAHAGSAAHAAAPHYRAMLAQAGIDLGGVDARGDAQALVDGGAFLAGTAEEICERIAEFREAGVSEIVLNTTGIAALRGHRAAAETLEAIARTWDAHARPATEPVATRPTVTVTGPGPHFDVTSRESLRAVKARLAHWSTGRSPHGTEPTGRTVVLESAELLPAVLAGDLVDERTLVLAPGPVTTDDPRVLAHGGRLDEPGQEFTLGDDFFLQVQSYGLSEFVTIAGATLVRLADVEDLEDFVADAARVRTDGTFPIALVHPAVQFADAALLAGDLRTAGPTHRLYVDAEGRCSVSPAGVVLGTVGDALTTLEGAWAKRCAAGGPGAGLLAGAPDGDRVASLLAAEPWLPRYLQAADLVRALTARGLADVRVSGFGARLAEPGTEDLGGPGDPQVAWGGDTAYVADPRSGRIFGLGRDQAALVERLVGHGPTGDHGLAQDLVEGIVGQLAAVGIRLGAVA